MITCFCVLLLVTCTRLIWREKWYTLTKSEGGERVVEKEKEHEDEYEREMLINSQFDEYCTVRGLYT